MKVPIPETIPAADELGRVHFVGIGGAGLSGIARIMLQRGIAVSGSDGTDSSTLDGLRALGAEIHVGHDAANLGRADTVVVSTAVPADNPEVTAALAAGLRVWPRSAGLASVMWRQAVWAVAGTHGKTTTSSMLTFALRGAGADPSFAIGADLAQLGTNAHHGTDPVFVAEADESDGAFLVYWPALAVITNIEADHLDHWGTEEAYFDAFDTFARRLDREGILICCLDDPGAAEIHRRARTSGGAPWAVGVGTAEGADLRVSDVRHGADGSRFTVTWHGELLGEVTLRMTGQHYVLDAACALAAGLADSYPFAGLRAGLEEFSGARRRMESKGSAGGVRVYDSYAHHPTEIRGDLASARALAGEGRVIVAFQPHLVSRTRIFAEQMGEALAAADEVVVLDVYLAREEADPEVTGALVADAVPLPAGRVRFVPGFDDVPAVLADIAEPGDLVLTLGAGTVTALGPVVLELLAGTERDA